MFNQLVHSRLPASILGDFSSSLVSIPSPRCMETLWKYIFLISFRRQLYRFCWNDSSTFRHPVHRKWITGNTTIFINQLDLKWLHRSLTQLLCRKKKKKKKERVYTSVRKRSKGYRARKTQTMWYTWRF